MPEREGYRRKVRQQQPTQAQKRVLDGIACGLTNAEMAIRLGLSPETIKSHVAELLAETGLPDRESLARWWDTERRRSAHAYITLSWLLRPSRVGAAVVGASGVAALAIFLAALSDLRDATGPEPVVAVIATATATVAAEKDESTTARAFFKPPFAAPAPAGVFETLRISGPDLPYPILVTPVEYFLATNTSGDVYNSWWVRDNLNPPPADGGPRYDLDLAYLDRDGKLVETRTLYVYVPGAPPLIGEGTRWREPSAWFEGLIDRYIQLARGRLIGPAPTLSEVLSASAKAFGAKVTLGEVRIDATVVGARTLVAAEAGRFLEELGGAEAAIFGVRGTLLGQKGYISAEVKVEFGELAGPRFFYMLAGSMAPYGMGIAPRSLGFWAYSPSASPPIYSQRVLMLSPGFDRVMQGLGYPTRKLSDIVDYRMKPLYAAQVDYRLTRGVAVWSESNPGKTIRIPVELCPTGCDVQPTVVTLPLSGERYVVAIDYAGVDPYPEDIEQPRYDYYPQGPSCPTLVQTRGLRTGGATNGIIAPFCAPAQLEGILQDAISRLQ